MKNDITEETVEETVEETTNATEVTGLGVNDLASIKHIIDVASARGAFKTEEFAVVGAVYSRLTAFLGAVATSAQDNLTESDDSTDAESVNDTEADDTVTED